MYFRVVYLFTFKYIHARFHSINLRLIRKVLMNIHRGEGGGPLWLLSRASFTGEKQRDIFLNRVCRNFVEFSFGLIRFVRRGKFS